MNLGGGGELSCDLVSLQSLLLRMFGHLGVVVADRLGKLPPLTSGPPPAPVTRSSIPLELPSLMPSSANFL